MLSAFRHNPRSLDRQHRNFFDQPGFPNDDAKNLAAVII